MPRNITITFDDGSSHQYANVPDNVTPDQVHQRAMSEFAGKQVSNIDGGSNVQAAKPTEQKSWLQRGLESGRQDIANVIGGAVRGAGSIGATLLAPVDMAKDAIDGKGLSLQSNRERRQRIDADLTSLVGSDPNSILYKGAKLGGEIAGTAGAGGVLANALTKLAPAVATAAPSVVNAIRTGGMTTGQTGGNALTNLAVRTLGGAVTGGASAGLVDPEYAGTGAIVGGAAPGVFKAAGYAGNVARNALGAGASVSPQKQAIFEAGNKLGLVAPPSQVNPTLGNQLVESLSGKIKTAQSASVKNASKVQDVVAKDLGVEAEKLTPEVLPQIRREAGNAYEAVRNVGQLQADQVFERQLASIGEKYKNASADFPGLKTENIQAIIDSARPKNGVFDTNSAIDAIKVLRENADKAYRTGDKAVGGASKMAADAIEGQIGRSLAEAEKAFPGQGYGDLLTNFQNARERIAKTYLAESAMGQDGKINPAKYAAALKKGKPLSDDVKTMAQFADAFPKAMEVQKGSVLPYSSLDAAVGGLSAAGGHFINPAAAAVMAGVVARPLARNALLSAPYQNRLLNPTLLEQLNAGDRLAFPATRAALNPLLAETSARK